ncbi:glycosyltransferase family 2 protein [Skermanella pratensis]|uniref:glycosyltransferase family 2 protein n=1 Tax=Skermanella pratensis TaxID=2233999 RepID=UPI0017879387|nr:glycosyltransferase [Skermanella pratensis]
MPSYNSAAFIREAIDSITAQTFPHFELLVCDDGSTDDTIGIVEELAEKDERIRLIRNQHGGVSRNCNVGLLEARFPWIARLDADDIAMPDRLETQIRAAERHPEVVCWGGAARLVSRQGRRLRGTQLGPVDAGEFEEIRRTGKVIYILGPTVMFRSDLALELGGYDPRFDGAEDIELLSRLADRGQVRTLPKVLTHYRIHGQSVTAHRSARQRVLFSFIEARNKARLDGGDLELDHYLANQAARPAIVRLRETIAGLGSQYYRNTSIHFAERRLLRAMATASVAMALQPVTTSQRFGGRVTRGIVRRVAEAVGVGRRAMEMSPEAGDRPIP